MHCSGVDETATGSANFFGPRGSSSQPERWVVDGGQPREREGTEHQSEVTIPASHAATR
jgi:hypothetical protein